VNLRSADGRGPLFWAYEYNIQEAIELLETFGVDPNVRDREGKTPLQLKGTSKPFAPPPPAMEFNDEDDEDDEDEDED